MTARKLRVASPSDPPTPALTLSQAIETGTYLEILRAQRVQMVKDLDGSKGPALAALHRQIALHSKEIAAIESAPDDEESHGADVEDGDFDASAV